MNNIWTAAADNNVDKVRALLDGGARADAKDANGYTPLHAAAEYAHLDLLRLLVERGGDVNVADADGDTPLHACESPAVAELLLELGADLNARNGEGQTPLEKAQDDGDFVELTEFLQRKAGIAPAASELPQNVHVRMQTEESTDLEVDEEQRKQLQQIIESGSVEGFKEFVQSAFDQQNLDTELSAPAKKR